MPLLFALGLPPPRSGESCCRARRSSRSLMTCTSSVHHHRVLEVHRILEEELRSHAQISLHHGKTQVWNRSGVPPRGIDMCCRLATGRIAAAMPARGENPRGSRWKARLRVEFFCNENRKNSRLGFNASQLWKIPRQRGCLMCASTRANYWLRCVRPDLTKVFAHRHDSSVWECCDT